MDRGKRLAKGTVIYALGYLGTKALSFVIVPIVTYYISPDDMGDYDILLSTVALLTPIITMRISDASYKWMLHESAPKRICIAATYRVLFISSITVSLIILGVYCIYPFRYCVYFMLLLILGRWLESLQTLLRGIGKQIEFAISGFIYTCIYVLQIIIRIVIMHEGIEAMFQSMVISEIIVILIIILTTSELHTGIIRSEENRVLTKKMLLYSIPLVPSALNWWIMGTSDRYVVRYYLGKTETGVYSVANKFPAIMTMMFVVFNFAWTDLAIADLEQGKETTEYSSTVFKSLYKVSFSFILILIPFTKVFAQTVLSDSYHSAAIYIGFLYLGAVFQGFTSFISVGILQGSDTKAIASSSLAGGLVNLIVDICLIKLIGLHAASISTFLGFFIMWLFRMKDVKKITPININVLYFSFLLLLSIIMAGVTIWTKLGFDIILFTLFLPVFLFVNKNELKKLFVSIKGYLSGN